MEKTDPDYNKLIKLTNGKLLRNGQFIKDDLWIRNGKIINPETVFFDEKVRAYRTINLKNCFIAPGYIDLQINGGWGVDFSSNISTVEEDITKVAQKLVEHGVTSFCPTLVTSPAETYHKILKRIPTNTINNGAGVLGVHLEGPFINPEKKGAHPIEYIRTLEKGYDSVLETYGSLDNVKIVTLAPEIDDKGDAIYMLKKKGITVSLGHSMGSLKDGERGIRKGASLITHLFNAMLPFHHRDPGLVGLLASDNIPKDRTVYFSIIADGVHTHPAALRIAYRIHPNGLCLVTDAISALGLEEGVHQIGQLKVELRGDKAFVAGTDTLCGSITPLDECVRIFKSVTGCTIAQAIEAATLHPARCLNIEKSKGTLDFDTDADFIITEDNLCILSTWIAGKPVYDRCCWETTENDVRIWPPNDYNC